MKEQAELVKHLTRFGKTDSWLNLAKQFNILPLATKKQRSDKVRKIANRIEHKEVNYVNTLSNVYSDTDYTVTTNPSVRVVKQLDREIPYQNRIKMQKNSFPPYLNGDIKNVLVIGDLHTPFELNGYLKFCREQQEKFNCGTVIFIGDLIDSHFSSYHETDPDGMSAGLELQTAINRLQDWYQTFPNATITIGNHDRIIARKLYTSGISARWLRPIEEVLRTPNWNFVEEIVFNDTLYIHGEGGTAKTKSQQEHISVVQGHSHTECYVDFNMTRQGVKFSMQVGTGIDFSQYAFGYAQRGKTPMISCGVILDKQPILIPYI